MPRAMADRGGWDEIFGRAPIGVLVLGALLLLVGAGLTVGGAVYALSGQPGSWPVWLTLFGAGPLAIYVALQFLWGRGWAWVTVVVMLVLTALTSALRTLWTEPFPVVPLIEVGVSLAVLGYLVRPHVRRTFDR